MQGQARHQAREWRDNALRLPAIDGDAVAQFNRDHVAIGGQLPFDVVKVDPKAMDLGKTIGPPGQEQIIIRVEIANIAGEEAALARVAGRKVLP